MKFSCDKNLLIEGVNNVQKAISVRTTMPILDGILIEADNNLVLTGYDLEIGIKYTMSANIVEPGRIVLNSRILGDIVKKAADNEINFSVDNHNNVKIKSGHSEFNIMGLDAETYPVFDDGNKQEIQSLTLPQKELKNLIKRTIFAVSLDEKRPNLNGCFFTTKDQKIEMVGIDGFRVSVADYLDENLSQGLLEVIIPAKTLRDLNSMLEESGEIKISKMQGQLSFDFGRNLMISRIIDEEYISYENIFPEQGLSKVKIKTKDFLECCERSVLMLSPEDKRVPITMQADGDVLQIKSVNTKGNFNETLNIDFSGEAFDIDVNPRYMIEALKVIDDEEIYMDLNGNVGPIILNPVKHNNYIFLILPLRK